MAFKLNNSEGSLQFDVFADSDGYLAGIDVSCNAYSAPMPEKPQLVEPPYHVYGALVQGP